MREIRPNLARQYIDAVSVFEACEDAEREALQVRGGMYWHKGPASTPEAVYLVRTSPKGAERSLGPRTPETERTYARFLERKQLAQDRLAALTEKRKEHERMNRALRVGRVDPIVVKVLDRMASSGLTEFFRVVGTHALYAYEAAAGVVVDDDAVATRDIDLLWDVRKRLHFATALARVDSSMLGVLKKVDKTFRLKDLDKYTAVNQDGFEVDILRREQQGEDPHPIRMSDDEDDFWVTQARQAHVLMDAPPFSAVIVASNGTMARMNTLHPLAFTRFKRWMSSQQDRDPLKRRRDALQAEVVEAMVKEYLPQWQAPAST